MPAEQTEQLRLFTAVELPADTRAGLAALQRDFPGMRWVEPSRMHLTLRFIGEVGGDAAEAVRQALAGVRAAPFVLRLKRLGSFYRRPSGALWAGFEANSRLLDLHDAVGSALEAACGLAPERRYTPHVTLGRIRETESKELKAFAQARTGLVRASFAVASFALVRSVLGPQGPDYAVLARYCLSAPAEEGADAVVA